MGVGPTNNMSNMWVNLENKRLRTCSKFIKVNKNLLIFYINYIKT